VGLGVRIRHLSRLLEFGEKLKRAPSSAKPSGPVVWPNVDNLRGLALLAMAVTVAAGEVRIRHGVREVAVHKQSEGRRLRIVDSTHLDGVAGRDGAVCRAEIAAPTVLASSPPPSLLRPLAEYEAAIGGSF
jgi:hypothetical protein